MYKYIEETLNEVPDDMDGEDITTEKENLTWMGKI